MLKTMLDNPGTWITTSGPESDTVLSTRGTLARNLADLPFPARCSEDEKRTVEDRVLQALENTGLLSSGSYIPLTELHVREVRMLIERNLITRQLIESRGPRGVYISHDQSLSLMINEREHIRICAIASGLRPDEIWSKLSQIDDLLDLPLDYAYHEKRGYLTSAIDEVGTGLKMSAVLHLPALAAQKRVLEFEKQARTEHHSLDGLFSDVSDSPGDFFVLTNRGTLGRSEGEIAFHLRTLATSIVRDEKDGRSAMLGEAGMPLADRVGRALGLARGARLLEFKEALGLLSALRLGVATGQLPGYSYPLLDEVLVTAQPAHIECKTGAPCDDVTLSTARAELFRQRFA